MAAMPTAPPNAAGIELFYETFGEPDGEPLLFVMGLGAQGHVWDEEMLLAFVDRGFFAIRFDNRDVGLSTKPEGIDAGVVTAGILSAIGGETVEAPYVLADMAARRGEPARPPRHRVRPHRRGVDGRDDRPADGHRPPRSGSGRSRRSCRPPGDRDVGQPDPVGRRAPAPASRRRPRRGDREQRRRSAGRSAARPTSTRSRPGAVPRSPTTAASTRRASPTSSSPSSRRRRAREALGSVARAGARDPRRQRSARHPVRRPPHRGGDPRGRAARAGGHGSRPAARLLAHDHRVRHQLAARSAAPA